MKTKEQFIKQLAVFLTKDQGRRSIEIEMKQPCAVAWAELRSETPLFGYPTYEEALAQLREFLV